MVELDPNELAQVLWKTNQPQAKPLDVQPKALQDTYLRAAEAVISWLVDKAIQEEGDGAALIAELADQLAWKLLHPQQYTSGALDALCRFQQRVGSDNVPPEVTKAIDTL